MSHTEIEIMTVEETALRLYKAHSQQGNIVEGDLIHGVGIKTGNIYILPIVGNLAYVPDCDPLDGVRINSETLSVYTGLNAEWAKAGIDKRIWSGDVLEIETMFNKNQRWEVVYKNAAFYVVKIGNEKIDQLLFGFLSDNVYTKIGSIHDQKEGK